MPWHSDLIHGNLHSIMTYKAEKTALQSINIQLPQYTKQAFGSIPGSLWFFYQTNDRLYNLT
jgi:hypothetical protein